MWFPRNNAIRTAATAYYSFPAAWQCLLLGIVLLVHGGIVLAECPPFMRYSLFRNSGSTCWKPQTSPAVSSCPLTVNMACLLTSENLLLDSFADTS